MTDMTGEYGPPGLCTFSTENRSIIHCAKRVGANTTKYYFFVKKIVKIFYEKLHICWGIRFELYLVYEITHLCARV